MDETSWQLEGCYLLLWYQSSQVVYQMSKDIWYLRKLRQVDMSRKSFTEIKKKTRSEMKLFDEYSE